MVKHCHAAKISLHAPVFSKNALTCLIFNGVAQMVINLPVHSHRHS